MDNILEKVQEKHLWLEEHKEQYNISHIIMTSLVGSQNYNLASNSSDIDTYSIVFPSYLDFIFGNPFKSFEHEFEDGSKVAVKDIRLVFSLLRKTSPNSIEYFVSHYKIYNDLFKDILTYYLENNELLTLITHCNYKHMVNAIAGCAAGLHGRNMSLGKMYSHALRLQDMLIHYLDDNCLPQNYLTLEPENLYIAFNTKYGSLTVEEQSYKNIVDVLKSFSNNYKVNEKEKAIEQSGNKTVNEFQKKLTEKFLKISK